MRVFSAWGIAIAALAVAVAACGGKAQTSSSTTGANPSATTGGSAGAFSWLHPSTPPAGWPVVRIPDGATMAYPPTWKRVKGDPGTATATLSGPDHDILGYLNLTPRQGGETVANWGRFRVDHNRDEGDRDVRSLSVGTGLRFRDGRGSCVRDSYASNTGVRYIEIACLVVGKRTAVVIVGAAPPQASAKISPLLERAISSVST